MKNGRATSNNTNIETLKAREDTISKALAKCTLNAYQKDEYPRRGRTLYGNIIEEHTENDTQIYVNNIKIENVKSYTYQGQIYSTTDKNQDKEIHRRITAGWIAFAKHRSIFNGSIGTCLKRHLYNSCVFQVHISNNDKSCRTWALTTHAKNKLAAAQTKRERSMLNIGTEQL